MSGRLRIIGGTWRSRVINFPEQPGLRPTPDRVRETLFNWLRDRIDGAHCLDLFAGSGALGFEAASRGAKHVTQIEIDQRSAGYLHDNAARLGAAQVRVIQGDALDVLRTNEPQLIDIVFLDPPFGEDLAIPACHALGPWLAARALIYVESEPGLTDSRFPESWRILKRQRTGAVEYRLFEASSHLARSDLP